MEKLKHQNTGYSGWGINWWLQVRVMTTASQICTFTLPEEGRQCPAGLISCSQWRSALMVVAQLLAEVAMKELQLVSTCLQSGLHVRTGMPSPAHVHFFPLTCTAYTYLCQFKLPFFFFFKMLYDTRRAPSRMKKAWFATVQTSSLQILCPLCLCPAHKDYNLAIKCTLGDRCWDNRTLNIVLISWILEMFCIITVAAVDVWLMYWSWLHYIHQM
jgi:hypothetical protein